MTWTPEFNITPKNAAKTLFVRNTKQQQQLLNIQTIFSYRQFGKKPTGHSGRFRLKLFSAKP